MRTPLSFAFLLATLLTACAPVGSRELHEVVLASDDGAVRLRYLYGSAATVSLDGRELELGRLVGDAAESDPYGVAAARTVDGAPLLRASLDATLEAPLSVARIPLTTDLRVTTRDAVARAYYFDGRRWFELGRDLDAGRTTTVAPRPVATPLRGAAALTPAEADALASGLASEGRPLIVAVLKADAPAGEDGPPDEPVPAELAARAPGGLDEYRHSLLWLQHGLETDAEAYRAPARRGLFEVVASGDQGNDPRRDRFVLIDDQDALRSFWNEVHATAFTPPPLPEARFARETLLGIRLAQRPSGGYRIEVDRVVREDDELFVDVRLIEPAEGSLSTTALTTPWTLVRVLGVDASIVWFRDPADGALFAVARADDAPF